MANRFWVGGTDTWDGTAGTKWATTSGGAGGAAVPGAGDDVFFDAASGAVTVTTSGTRVGRSLDFTGFTGTFTMAAALNIGTTTTPGSSKWIILGAGMTWTSAVQQISCRGNLAATNFDLVQNGINMGATTIERNGANGTMRLQGGTIGTLRLVSGATEVASDTTLTNASPFTCVNATTKSIVMTANLITASAVTIGTGTLLTSSGTGKLKLRSTAGSVTHSMSNPGTLPGLQLEPAAAQTATFTGAFTALSFDVDMTVQSNVLYAVATFPASGTVTFTGAFTSSNASFRHMLFASPTPGTATTISAATASLTNTIFRDVTGSGAASWTGTNIGNAQGNSGITFTGAATQFYVGGAGSWNNGADITNWASTSGGTGGTGRLPLPQDNVTFDASSGSGAITVNTPWLGTDLTVSGSCTLNMSAAGAVIPSNPALLGALNATVALGTGNGMLLANRGSQNFASTVATPLVAVGSGVTASPTTVNQTATSIVQQINNIQASTWNQLGFDLTVNVTYVLGFGASAFHNTGAGALFLAGTGALLSDALGVGTALSLAGGGIISVTDTSTTARSITLGNAAGNSHTLSSGFLILAGNSVSLTPTTITPGAGTTFPTIGSLITAGRAQVIFTIAKTYSISAGATIFSSSTIKPAFISSAGGTQAVVTYGGSAGSYTWDFLDVTDHDANGTIPQYSRNGTLSNTTDWNLAVSRTTSDSAPASDVAARQLALPRGTGDSAPASDVAAVSAASIARTVSDAAGGTDVASRQLALARIAADTAPASDVAVGSRGQTRTVSDSAPASDVASRQLALARIAADTAGATDTSTTSHTQTRTLTDAAGGTDVASRLLALARIAADTAPATDVAEMSRGQARFVSDSAPASDVADRQLALFRTPADSAPATDTASGSTPVTRTTSDSAPASDVAARQLALSRLTGDTASAVDSVTISSGSARAAGDAAGGNDVTTRTLFLPRFTTDSAPATDVATWILTGPARPGCADVDFGYPLAIITISQPTATITLAKPTAAVAILEC